MFRTRPIPGKDAPLKDRLEYTARTAQSGGRAKWLVWALIGGAVFVVGMLQILGITKNPTAERIRELHENEKAKEASPPSPPAAPAAMDQGTTK